MTARNFGFAPMTARDLDWVAAREAELHPFPWTRGNFADSLASAHLCRLMLDGETPVAYAVALTVIDEAHLLNISVARAEQRRGLGGRLLEHLVDGVRGDGIRRFFLEVRPSNAAALALYRHAGFI